MQTIVTRVLPATNTKCQRIKATAGFDDYKPKRSVTISQYFSGQREDSHKAAAIAFA
jgi:hypothetical protein